MFDGMLSQKTIHLRLAAIESFKVMHRFINALKALLQRHSKTLLVQSPGSLTQPGAGGGCPGAEFGKMIKLLIGQLYLMQLIENLGSIILYQTRDVFGH